MWQKFEVVTVTDRTWVWECPSCQAEHEHVEEHDAPSRPSRGSLASRFVCVYERDVLRVVCVCRRSHGRVCVCVLPLHTFFEAPWLSLVYVLSWDCRDSVAAKVRAPRQERIRAAHRQQQAVAAQAREARHGGGTSFPPVDMLVYDDSDDEGHDDDLDVSRQIALQLVQYYSRYSSSDDSDADARGNFSYSCLSYTIFSLHFPVST